MRSFFRLLGLGKWAIVKFSFIEAYQYFRHEPRLIAIGPRPISKPLELVWTILLIASLKK